MARTARQVANSPRGTNSSILALIGALPSSASARSESRYPRPPGWYSGKLVGSDFEASDPSAVLSYFDLRCLRRDQPSIECIPHAIPASTVPTLGGEDLDVDLLAGSEVNISVLVEVSVVAYGRDVIMPRRDITIECAAIGGRPEVAAIHIDIREVQALGWLSVPVESDPGFARWDRRCRHCE